MTWQVRPLRKTVIAHAKVVGEHQPIWKILFLVKQIIDKFCSSIFCSFNVRTSQCRQ